jgi:hypothetical protein
MYCRGTVRRGGIVILYANTILMQIHKKVITMGLGGDDVCDRENILII